MIDWNLSLQTRFGISEFQLQQILQNQEAVQEIRDNGQDVLIDANINPQELIAELANYYTKAELDQMFEDLNIGNVAQQILDLQAYDTQNDIEIQALKDYNTQNNIEIQNLKDYDTQNDIEVQALKDYDTQNTQNLLAVQQYTIQNDIKNTQQDQAISQNTNNITQIQQQLYYTNVDTEQQLRDAVLVQRSNIRLTAPIILTQTLTIPETINIYGNGMQISNSSTLEPMINITGNDVYFDNQLYILYNYYGSGADRAVEINGQRFVSRANYQFGKTCFYIKGSCDISGKLNMYGDFDTDSRCFNIYQLTGPTKIHDVDWYADTRAVARRKFAYFTGTIWDYPITFQRIKQRFLQSGQFILCDSFTKAAGQPTQLHVDQCQYGSINGDIGIFLTNDNNLDKFDMISITNNIEGNHTVGNYKGMLYFPGTAINIENTRIFLSNNVGGHVDRSGYVPISSTVDQIAYLQSGFTNVYLIPHSHPIFDDLNQYVKQSDQLVIDNAQNDNINLKLNITDFDTAIQNYTTTANQQVIDGAQDTKIQNIETQLQQYVSKYVDPVNGLDTNPGTFSQPYKTIQYVLDTFVHSYVVYVRGSYTQPIVFNSANNNIFISMDIKSQLTGDITLVDGNTSIYFISPQCVIDGITIQDNSKGYIVYDIQLNNVTYNKTGGSISQEGLIDFKKSVDGLQLNLTGNTRVLTSGDGSMGQINQSSGVVMLTHSGSVICPILTGMTPVLIVGQNIVLVADGNGKGILCDGVGCVVILNGCSTLQYNMVSYSVIDFTGETGCQLWIYSNTLIGPNNIFPINVQNLNSAKYLKSDHVPNNYTVAGTDVQNHLVGIDNKIQDLNTGIQNNLNSLAVKQTQNNGIKYTSQTDPGFVMSYSYLTRTVTLTGTIQFYVGENLFSKTSPFNIIHGTEQGSHYIYFDENGNPVDSQTPWNLFNTAQVAYIYHDTVTPSNTICLFECHPGGQFGMSAGAHYNLHMTRGTRLISGCQITYTLGPNIDWSLQSGILVDEDIKYNVGSTVSGTYRIFHRVSPTQYTSQNNNSYGGIIADGTNPIYDLNGVLTAITTNNKYFNYYIIALPAIGTRQAFSVAGQNIHDSLSEAQIEQLPNISTFTTEAVFLYRMTYVRTPVNSSTFNTRLESVSLLNLSIIQTVSGTVQEAGNITVDSSGFAGILSATDTNVQTALQTIDSHNHDNLYYTETETNNLLVLKQDALPNVDKLVRTNATNTTLETYTYSKTDIDTKDNTKLNHSKFGADNSTLWYMNTTTGVVQTTASGGTAYTNFWPALQAFMQDNYNDKVNLQNDILINTQRREQWGVLFQHGKGSIQSVGGSIASKTILFQKAFPSLTLGKITINILYDGQAGGSVVEFSVTDSSIGVNGFQLNLYRTNSFETFYHWQAFYTYDTSGTYRESFL